MNTFQKILTESLIETIKKRIHNIDCELAVNEYILGINAFYEDKKYFMFFNLTKDATDSDTNPEFRICDDEDNVIEVWEELDLERHTPEDIAEFVSDVLSSS